MTEQAQNKSGLSDAELEDLMNASNAVMDAAVDIVAPGQKHMTLAQMAMAALACKAAGERLELAVKENMNTA